MYTLNSIILFLLHFICNANKTDRPDMQNVTGILLKLALNTINQTSWADGSCPNHLHIEIYQDLVLAG
jgi:hypothetical protein